MRLNEIFVSIDGEGLRTGLPVVFVRFYGCNLRCNYCDTQYSCKGNEYKETKLQTIVERVLETGIPRVTITGGEPLLQPNLLTFVNELLKHDIEVNIETNGSMPIGVFLLPGVIVTMDYKCVSSGMDIYMLSENIRKLRDTDVLKFVVGCDVDLNQLRDVYHYGTQAQIYVSPVFGKIEPKKIVEYVISHKLHDVRVQVQLHKIIWDPNERGV